MKANNNNDSSKNNNKSNAYVAQLKKTGLWFDGRAFLAVNEEDAEAVSAKDAAQCASNFSLIYDMRPDAFRISRRV